MTYWTVGAFVSERLKNAQWGSKTVEALSDYLKTRNPKRRGFGKRHIYNMVSFYDTYTSPEFQSISERLRLHEFAQLPTAQIEDGAIVQSPIAQIEEGTSLQSKTVKAGNGAIVQSPIAQFDDMFIKFSPFPLFLPITSFTNHIQILNHRFSMEEKVFYILYSARERLNSKELVRAFAAQTYDMVMSKEKNMSAKLKSVHPGADFLLKDKVLVDFLRLPEKHNERALRCLVDVELKAVSFEPEFAGKVDFYIAANDDQIKREGENPSVGIILCPEAGMCEVKYSIDRTMSPMMIAEYKRLLVPEEVMKKSLEDYCEFMKHEDVRGTPLVE